MKKPTILKVLQSADFFTICARLSSTRFQAEMLRMKNRSVGKVPYYAIEDQFPYGHGEKSVFLIERKMHLKIDEAMAIRWHMGEFGDKTATQSVRLMTSIRLP